MEKQILEVELKSVYGRELIYPKNELAQNILQLTGRKTFYKKDLEILKKAGFQIKTTVPDIFS